MSLKKSALSWLFFQLFLPSIKNIAFALATISKTD